MSMRTITVCAAAVVLAVPAAAQQRGTMEFGAFGSAARFDEALSLKTAVGGGGRIGMFLEPRLAIEFEDAEMRASRPNGLQSVNVGLLSGRLVATAVQSGALSLLVGAGAGVSTETNFLHSYGVDALVGAKFKINDRAAFRVDGVWDWLANEDWKQYKSVRVGLSLYRHPAVRTVMTTTMGPTVRMPSNDSVSAAETRRLRDRDAELRALRDSLRNAPPRPSAAAVQTMEAHIHFAFDKSELSDSARAVLDDKVAVFRANPEMSIMMSGYTDVKGTDAYNMALGTRRAQAAKDYLVSQGIAANRIIIDSKGEREQIGSSTGAVGEANNRRAVFHIMIAPDVR